MCYNGFTKELLESSSGLLWLTRLNRGGFVGFGHFWEMWEKPRPCGWRGSLPASAPGSASHEKWKWHPVGSVVPWEVAMASHGKWHPGDNHVNAGSEFREGQTNKPRLFPGLCWVCLESEPVDAIPDPTSLGPGPGRDTGAMSGDLLPSRGAAAALAARRCRAPIHK